jgi:hypothetical protein
MRKSIVSCVALLTLKAHTDDGRMEERNKIYDVVLDISHAKSEFFFGQILSQSIILHKPRYFACVKKFCKLLMDLYFQKNHSRAVFFSSTQRKSSYTSDFSPHSIALLYDFTFACRQHTQQKQQSVPILECFSVDCHKRTS